MGRTRRPALPDGGAGKTKSGGAHLPTGATQKLVARVADPGPASPGSATTERQFPPSIGRCAWSGVLLQACSASFPAGESFRPPPRGGGRQWSWGQIVAPFFGNIPMARGNPRLVRLRSGATRSAQAVRRGKSGHRGAGFPARNVDAPVRLAARPPPGVASAQAGARRFKPLRRISATENIPPGDLSGRERGGVKEEQSTFTCTLTFASNG